MNAKKKTTDKFRDEDPDHMSGTGKMAAFVLLLLFACYLIFFSH